MAQDIEPDTYDDRVPEGIRRLGLSPDVAAALSDIATELREAYEEARICYEHRDADAVALLRKAQAQLSFADAALLDPVIDLLTSDP